MDHAPKLRIGRLSYDEWRVRLIQQKLRSGLSAAEAAQEVARMEHQGAPPDESFETPLEHGRMRG